MLAYILILGGVGFNKGCNRIPQVCVHVHVYLW